MGSAFFQTNISHINIYLLFYKKPANGEEEEEEEDVSKLSERMDNSFYHSMQMFLPFHWPRAHHVTCK